MQVALIACLTPHDAGLCCVCIHAPGVQSIPVRACNELYIKAVSTDRAIAAPNQTIVPAANMQLCPPVKCINCTPQLVGHNLSKDGAVAPRPRPCAGQAHAEHHGGKRQRLSSQRTAWQALEQQPGQWDAAKHRHLRRQNPAIVWQPLCHPVTYSTAQQGTLQQNRTEQHQQSQRELPGHCGEISSLAVYVIHHPAELRSQQMAPT